MKKPVNKFAVALWVLAVLVLVCEVASFALMEQNLTPVWREASETFTVVGTLWNIMRGAVSTVAQLAAFGVIIELIDQIRWNALRRTK
jgi:hypothetical protein